LLPLGSQAADDNAAMRAAVDAAIRPLMAEYDVPGMAVAVTVDGKAQFFSYGVATRANQAPVSEATIFELGSISKTFTATLTTYAQLLGKLSLEDHPGQYIPQLKGSPIDRASLKNLGTYTAGGLPLQFPEGVANTDAAMVRYFQNWQPDTAPSLQRLYSNPSIGLMGRLAALALQRDFAEVMESQIFRGLGLRNTYIHVPQTAMPQYAWGYNKANKPVRVNPDLFDAEAYGVKTTAADLIRFVQFNIDPQQLAAPLRRAVEDTHIGYFDIGSMVQGLGWEQFPYPVTLAALLAGNSDKVIIEANTARPIAAPGIPSTPTLYDKTGSTGGFGAYAAFVPSKRIGIVILANKNYPIPARVKAAHAILEQLGTAAK
jgi:beta-lactamase class C